jgi:hypothetical protein
MSIETRSAQSAMDPFLTGTSRVDLAEGELLESMNCVNLNTHGIYVHINSLIIERKNHGSSHTAKNIGTGTS